jgi:hypothetical protein
MKITVENLRNLGYKVRVLHYRKNEKGGKTVIQVKTPEGIELEGTAVCSRKENYNKKLGVSIALGRALNGVNNES